MKRDYPYNNFNPRDAGFRCGLEIHQQLDTEKKLFCHCPAGVYSDEYNAQLLRHMRPTLSELGEYDGTALMEFKTRKDIIYRINKDSACTYETDDTPPFPINKQAVDIAIEIALLLNCSIVGELHVIRKQYLDGSIPAGFQRTAIVGVNGWIPFKNRKIEIFQLAIEEDACREVSDVGHLRTYTTDRLAMPLIEVVTAPHIYEPEEAYEVGMQIGRLLRAMGKVRRGIGSVRQDVNVSIEGGTRVEIKGVPRLPLIPRLVYFEAYRQHRLLQLREMMHERGIEEDNLQTERFDITGRLEHPAITVFPDESFIVSVLLLKKMAGLFAHKIGPDRRFADDVAGRVRVIACLIHRPVILHTDDTSSSAFSHRDMNEILSVTGMKKDDLAVVVWGPPDDVVTGLNEIEIRCREAAVGIPNETRQRMTTGETDFERILPGPDRMYPDTDSPPLVIPRDHVAEIRKKLPEQPLDREKRYKKQGLPDHLTWMMAISPRAVLFDRLVSEGKIEPVLAATVLVELMIHLFRLGGEPETFGDDDLENLFTQHRQGSFTREGFRMLIEESAQTGSRNWTELTAKIGIRRVKPDEVKSIITDAASTVAGVNPMDEAQKFRMAMGLVMEKLRGSVPGTELAQMVKETLKPD
ncbi:Glu-tRNA(Gln) amidotransferase subunit GatE [bacterium]|nr:Glu-tRNA(Gln) amidotransferase subunit GatE [bacterium]